MTLETVVIDAERRVVVRFSLFDDDETPLALTNLDGDPSFLIAWIDVDTEFGNTRYQNYIVREVEGQEFVRDGATMQPALATAEQAGTDSGGELIELEPGIFQYVFGDALPEDFDTSATHTVAAFATRDGRGTVSNELLHFVPDESEIAATRDVVRNESCDTCHGELSFHGGARKKVGLCVLCHTDQTVDPESGENLEMSLMTHKIHRGEDLINLPYFIVGFRQSVHDYSEVAFPQDHQRCASCHSKDDSGGADASIWRTQPKRAACNGCHDDVDFVTGENHASGLEQDSDDFCQRCHRPEQVEEFDRSVPGSHLLPEKSSFNPDLKIVVSAVSGVMPGIQPTVRFQISDTSGTVDITTLDRVAVSFAGPTSDYSQLLSDGRFTIQGGGATPTLVMNGPGDYSFTPDGYMIPADATESWGIGLEGRTSDIDLNGTGTKKFIAPNSVVAVDLSTGTLGTGAPKSRRVVVTKEKCDSCHGDLTFHGGSRTDIEYCIMCHNTWATDEAQRPGIDEDSNPPESIDFKLMIHRIHRGHDLENPYSVFGFGMREHDYGDLHYPTNLARCEACHVEGTELLPPSSGAKATVVNIGGTPVPQNNAIRTPSTAACTGCHDGDDAFTHARVNSIVNSPTDWGESCSICHGEGKSVDASAIHKAR